MRQKSERPESSSQRIVKNIRFSAIFAADMPMRMPTKATFAPPPVIDSWTFRVTPYFCATALSGSTTVKGYTSDINASFFDILVHTQFPKGLFQVAAFGEARYGRFALLSDSDIAYMKLGIGADQSRSRDMAVAYEVARWGATMSPGSGYAVNAGTNTSGAGGLYPREACGRITL